MRIKEISITLVLVILLALAALNFSSLTGYFTAKEEVKTIRIGYGPFLSNLPVFVAQEKGFFESEDLKVELIKMTTVQEINNALVTGVIDVAFPNGLEMLLVTENVKPNTQVIFGAKVMTLKCKDKQLSCGDDQALIVRNKSITQISELADKKIGIHPSTPQKLLAKMWKEKIFPNDNIQFVEVPISMHLQALEKGDVDAVLTAEPVIAVAKKKQIGKVLKEEIYASTLYDPIPLLVYTISTKALNEKPMESQKFLRVYKKAVEYIHEHPIEARKTAAKYVNLDEAILANAALVDQQSSEEIDVKALEYLQEQIRKYTNITSSVNVQDLLLK